MTEQTKKELYETQGWDMPQALRNGAKWCTDEERALVFWVAALVPLSYICKIHKRSPRSIILKLKRLAIRQEAGLKATMTMLNSDEAVNALKPEQKVNHEEAKPVGFEEESDVANITIASVHGNTWAEIGHPIIKEIDAADSPKSIP